MYKLAIEGHFDAAHYLRDYDGPCARTHGHTWKIQVRVAGSVLQDNGILIDFKILKQKLKDVLDKFDHYCINEVEPFDKINPTAENLSKYIYKELWEVISSGTTWVDWIRVWESPKAYCEYSE